VLGFWPSDAVLVVVQAATVCVPRPAPPSWLRRLGSSAWAAVLPVSLGGTIALLAVDPGSASVYTWVALLGIPPLAARALMRRSRGLLPGVLAAVLFVLAWRADGLLAQGAALALTALSAVTLGVLLAELAAPWVLEVGIVLMAVLDSILVFGQLLEGPNDQLNAAVPASGLPQLQVAVFGGALIGYGDLFVAAVLGAVLVRRGASSRRIVMVGGVTLACSALFDLLFFAVDTLPATVPVAVAMLLTGPAMRFRRIGPFRPGDLPRGG
jgi:hypothetical protein